MEKNNIENIKTIHDERVNQIISEINKDGGKILYLYLRGSHCQGLDTERSDKDYGMFYLSKIENLIDLGFNYKDHYADDRSDVYCQELRKVCQLLLKSNPTVLETLFVDDEFVIYEHPLITELKKFKYKFLSKDCYKPFFGYAKSQLVKATSQKKAVMKKVLKRKMPIDFAMCTYKQGSCHFSTWLSYRGLKPQYVGLVNIPKMDGCYSVFYDWGNHFLHEGITAEDLVSWYDPNVNYDIINIFKKLEAAKDEEDDEKIAEYEALMEKAKRPSLVNYIIKQYLDPASDTLMTDLKVFYEVTSKKLLGYRGVQSENADELRLSSVEKDTMPITFIQYSKDKFSQHCREFKEQQEWIKMRNPERFKQNLENMEKIKERNEETGFYDSKNLCQLTRIITNWLEIVRDGKYIVNRRNIDRDYLLKIKKGELTYNEIMKKANAIMAEAEKYTATCKLPEHADVDFLNNWLLEVRYMQLKNQLK